MKLVQETFFWITICLAIISLASLIQSTTVITLTDTAMSIIDSYRKFTSALEINILLPLLGNLFGIESIPSPVTDLVMLNFVAFGSLMRRRNLTWKMKHDMGFLLKAYETSVTPISTLQAIRHSIGGIRMFPFAIPLLFKLSHRDIVTVIRTFGPKTYPDQEVLDNYEGDPEDLADAIYQKDGETWAVNHDGAHSNAKTIRKIALKALFGTGITIIGTLAFFAWDAFLVT